VDDPRQPIKRCPIHGWLLKVLPPGNDAPDVVERIFVRLSRPKPALVAHPSGTQSTAGRFSLQRTAPVKCLCGLGEIRGESFAMVALHIIRDLRELPGYDEETRPMRGWRAVGIVAVLLGVGAVSGPIGAVEPDEATPAAPESVAERGSRDGFTEVASLIYAEPVLAVEGLSIEAIVFVETGKHLRAVRCPLFIVERDAPETTITVDCEARKTALGKQASFEVRADNPEFTDAFLCNSGGELRRYTRFSCTVTDPNMTESAA
jgi:hypothetical protein